MFIATNSLWPRFVQTLSAKGVKGNDDTINQGQDLANSHTIY